MQNDFNPLKHKQQSYMRAPCLWEKRAFFLFIGFERLHKHTCMRQNPHLCKYPHKQSDLGLERENGRKRKRICNGRYIGSGVLLIGPSLSDFTTSH